SSSVTLTVHYKPDVTIRRLLPAGNPVEGSELQLQCDVDSKPPAQAVVWWGPRGGGGGGGAAGGRGDEEDEEAEDEEAEGGGGGGGGFSERVNLDGKGGLRIGALNKSDNGTYRCLARNAVGSSHRDFTLIVHDPGIQERQAGTDTAVIGGVVAVVVFATLCLLIVLGRYLARHKGTYLTHEAKGAEDAPDADTAIINAEGGPATNEEKKEYFI
uniref:Cell adhesion molecule 1-like n=1 Tax=Petromyzon marinus TaxID=7757 RepID=A0AAJ7SMA2_PETMA